MIPEVEIESIKGEIVVNLVEKHFRETEKLVRSVSADKIADWLLKDGYYPEQYVFPPNFKTKNFKLNLQPYSKIKIKKSDFLSFFAFRSNHDDYYNY